MSIASHPSDTISDPSEIPSPTSAHPRACTVNNSSFPHLEPASDYLLRQPASSREEILNKGCKGPGALNIILRRTTALYAGYLTIALAQVLEGPYISGELRVLLLLIAMHSSHLSQLGNTDIW